MRRERMRKGHRDVCGGYRHGRTPMGDGYARAADPFNKHAGLERSVFVLLEGAHVPTGASRDAKSGLRHIPIDIGMSSSGCACLVKTNCVAEVQRPLAQHAHVDAAPSRVELL